MIENGKPDWGEMIKFSGRNGVHEPTMFRGHCVRYSLWKVICFQSSLAASLVCADSADVLGPSIYYVFVFLFYYCIYFVWGLMSKPFGPSTNAEVHIVLVALFLCMSVCMSF